MTKKDYIAIAKAISETKAECEVNYALTRLENKLCLIFKDDNPRFDPSKFLEACELSENTNKEGN